MEGHKVIQVLEDSIGEEVGIEPGDRILAINGKPIKDALDYHLLVQDEYIEVTVLKTAQNEEWDIEVEKDPYEDLGLVFENDLMDHYKSCRNKCIFCFIDQLPKGMRETLYFKDDDARLSFLQGNYITLTNMKDEDVDRIIDYHLSPINLSIHTMNMDLRKKMLGNRFADRLIGYMDRLFEAGITMNGQIVLCKGVNDGKELEASIEAMAQYLPHLQSVSVVPVGLSKHREGLYALEPFTKEDAQHVVQTVKMWQDKLAKEHELHFIHAADEFYFLAEEDMPSEETYDGYLQLENGVGMTRLLIDEFEECYNELENSGKAREIAIATGVLIAPVIQDLVKKLQHKFENIKVHIYPITNHFFGERITVSGLLTGQDIISGLKGKILGERLLLPSNLLRSGEEVLLDDVTVTDIGEALGVTVETVTLSGEALIQGIIG